MKQYHCGYLENLQSEKERTALTRNVNKTTLLLRVLVSGYILYMAYELFKGYAEADNQMVSLIAIIVFVAGGGLIFVSSAYKLARGDYEDGRMEKEPPEAEQDVEEHSESQSVVEADAEQESDKEDC